jgi:glycosyltransferase involved in cell wall biosynthesis
MKKISIVSPCYNEEQNIDILYSKINKEIENLHDYIFEIIFIDNASTDNTADQIKKIISIDKRVKLIINIKNFGHIKSPYWGIMQAKGDAVIYLASDLQDDPKYIPEFIRLWEEGWPIIMATKEKTELGILDKILRKSYYKILNLISENQTIKNATGFGLYDKKIIKIIKLIDDREPYFRGMVAELGYKIYELKIIQKKRKFGKSKNNLYTLYEYAMIGIISQSILPIRLMSIAGFLIAILSFLIGLFYIIKKLIYWETYKLGISPLLLPVIFLFGIQFVFIGIIGEYLRVLVIKAKNRPVVIEKERINFD